MPGRLCLRALTRRRGRQRREARARPRHKCRRGPLRSELPPVVCELRAVCCVLGPATVWSDREHEASLGRRQRGRDIVAARVHDALVAAGPCMCARLVDAGEQQHTRVLLRGPVRHVPLSQCVDVATRIAALPWAWQSQCEAHLLRGRRDSEVGACMQHGRLWQGCLVCRLVLCDADRGRQGGCKFSSEFACTCPSRVGREGHLCILVRHWAAGSGASCLLLWTPGLGPGCAGPHLQPLSGQGRCI